LLRGASQQGALSRQTFGFKHCGQQTFLNIDNQQQSVFAPQTRNGSTHNEKELF
jgi:hypothetical protein